MRIGDLRIGQGVVFEGVGIVTELKEKSVTLETKEGQIFVRPEHLTVLKEA